jgi:hypothetical protein
MTVAIYASRSPNLGLAGDPALTIATDAQGNFTGALQVSGTTYFRAAGTVTLRDLPDDLCKRLLASRDDCTRTNLAPFFVATAKTVRVEVSSAP